MVRDDRWKLLEERLGHRFERAELLRDALTHRSFVNEHRDAAPQHNERLEFLGDALLGLAASVLLFRRFPDAREGELSTRRADLVCERSLSRIARELELGPLLRLGKGEVRSGGRDKPRLLASALEAIVAAVSLDADDATAIAVATRLIEGTVEAEEPGARDYKSRLQARLQEGGGAGPVYVLAGAEGPEHARLFRVEVHIGDSARGTGEGRSKQEAEQLAAEDALARLDADED